VAEKIKAYVEMIVHNLAQTGSAFRCDSSSSVLRWSSPPAGWVVVMLMLRCSRALAGWGWRRDPAPRWGLLACCHVVMLWFFPVMKDSQRFVRSLVGSCWLVADTKSLASGFLVCSCTHVNRQLNVCARILAHSRQLNDATGER
jgi:hypothetical protein